MIPYEPVIGLEIHVELNTKSKVFCGCAAGFGAPPNTQVCPVCLGLPGSLPVLNAGALTGLLAIALALECSLPSSSQFHRKNYHYPDLPKGYQISQYDRPLATGGQLRYEVEGVPGCCRITRVHLEEDTGKLIHRPGETLVDFNRAGVPLVEIVGEPEIHSPAAARAFLEELRLVILYTGVSDVRMEEGSLRCDANISLRPGCGTGLGPLTEIKNMNSFRSVERALTYEVERQRRVLESGRGLTRQTRHWDEERGVTVSSRSKEEAHDYRYFPDPDLVPLTLDQQLVDAVAAALPRLPQQRRRRFLELGLPAYDTQVLTHNRELGDLLDACVERYADAKQLSNWIMTGVQGQLNATGRSLADTRLGAEQLVELLQLVDRGQLSYAMARELLPELMDTGAAPGTLADERGLTQVSDEATIVGFARRVIAENPEAVADYLAGREKIFGFLVGQVMQLSAGAANPTLVRQVLSQQLAAVDPEQE